MTNDGFGQRMAAWKKPDPTPFEVECMQRQLENAEFLATALREWCAERAGAKENAERALRNWDCVYCNHGVGECTCAERPWGDEP